MLQFMGSQSDMTEQLNWMVKWVLCKCSEHVLSPIKGAQGGSFRKEIGL